MSVISCPKPERKAWSGELSPARVMPSGTSICPALLQALGSAEFSSSSSVPANPPLSRVAEAAVHALPSRFPPAPGLPAGTTLPLHARIESVSPRSTWIRQPSAGKGFSAWRPWAGVGGAAEASGGNALPRLPAAPSVNRASPSPHVVAAVGPTEPIPLAALAQVAAESARPAKVSRRSHVATAAAAATTSDGGGWTNLSVRIPLRKHASPEPAVAVGSPPQTPEESPLAAELKGPKTARAQRMRARTAQGRARKAPSSPETPPAQAAAASAAAMAAVAAAATASVTAAPAVGAATATTAGVAVVKPERRKGNETPYYKWKPTDHRRVTCRALNALVDWGAFGGDGKRFNTEGDHAQGYSRELYEIILVEVFGPRFCKGGVWYRRCNAYTILAELIRLATRGRVQLTEAEVRGPLTPEGCLVHRDGADGGIIFRPGGTGAWTVNAAKLEALGVAKGEFEGVCSERPICLPDPADVPVVPRAAAGSGKRRRGSCDGGNRALPPELHSPSRSGPSAGATTASEEVVPGSVAELVATEVTSAAGAAGGGCTSVPPLATPETSTEPLGGGCCGISSEGCGSKDLEVAAVHAVAVTPKDVGSGGGSSGGGSGGGAAKAAAKGAQATSSGSGEQHSVTHVETREEVMQCGDSPHTAGAASAGTGTPRMEALQRIHAKARELSGCGGDGLFSSAAHSTAFDCAVAQMLEVLRAELGAAAAL